MRRTLLYKININIKQVIFPYPICMNKIKPIYQFQKRERNRNKYSLSLLIIYFYLCHLNMIINNIYCVDWQTKSDVWVMFAAVASHKFVISFCMGMELMTSQADTRTYIGSIVFFAVVSPIGIIIGSLISSNMSTETLPVAIAEVLIYIS